MFKVISVQAGALLIPPTEVCEVPSSTPEEYKNRKTKCIRITQPNIVGRYFIHLIVIESIEPIERAYSAEEGTMGFDLYIAPEPLL